MISVAPACWRSAGTVQLKGIDPVAQQVCTRVAGLFRVELGGPQRAVFHCGDEAAVLVLGPVDQGRAGPAVGVQLPLLDPVGVDEVEALVGWEAIEHLAARGVGFHGVPAHVRQDLRVEATDGTRPLPRALDLRAAVGAVGEFYAVFEEDMHAHANAENWTDAGERIPYKSGPQGTSGLRLHGASA